jgi:hypothetical protein
MYKFTASVESHHLQTKRAEITTLFEMNEGSSAIVLANHRGL